LTVSIIMSQTKPLKHGSHALQTLQCKACGLLVVVSAHMFALAQLQPSAHFNRRRQQQQVLDPEPHSSLDSIPSTRCKTPSSVPMSVSESVAVFLQLHPSAAMGRCRERQAVGLCLMSTLAWTAWPPCMLQWTP